MSTQAELRQQITKQIIEALEQGGLPPWRRPWVVSKNGGRPTNVASKKPYQGVNPLLLELHGRKHGFNSKWWGTYRQWQELGGQVMKRPDGVDPGAWGCKVVFFRPITKTTTDPQTGVEVEERFGLLKTYCLFNADQVSGRGINRYQAGEPVAVANVVPRLPTSRRTDRCYRSRHSVRRRPSVLLPTHAKWFVSEPFGWGLHPDATQGTVLAPRCLLRYSTARIGALVGTEDRLGSPEARLRPWRIGCRDRRLLLGDRVGNSARRSHRKPRQLPENVAARHEERPPLHLHRQHASEQSHRLPAGVCSTGRSRNASGCRTGWYSEGGIVILVGESDTELYLAQSHQFS